MDFAEYKQAVMEDALNWMREDDRYLDYLSFSECYDDMFVEDSITGNGSGSYTFDSQQAEANVVGLVFDSDFHEAMSWAGYDNLADVFDTPEGADVRARCVALGEVSGALEDEYDDLWRAYEENNPN